MPRRSTTFPLTLLPNPPGVPATRWLCDALRTEILEGRLSPGARLPATRDLAAQYRLSRRTVVNALRNRRGQNWRSRVAQRDIEGGAGRTTSPTAYA